MATFLEYKNKVVDVFGECITFAEGNGFENHLEALCAGKKRVEEDKLVVLVCGEARLGKSTLLSALLEDDGIFPVDVEVTTCLATVVTWGEQEKITVTFEDGKEKTISRLEIQEYATEKRNENNKKMAKWITVETPNPKLKDGLTFIDTPGVGSLNHMHTEVTYNFLPRADIVLFVSAADKPLTSSELTFLRGVKKHCDNFLFILTKKDVNAQYETIINENIGKIEEFAEIPKEKVCYIPVSGTMRLAGLKNGSERMTKSSNFAQLEETMWGVITKNRAKIIIAPPLVELASCLKEIEKEIHIKATGLSGSAAEQEELKNKLKELQEDRQRLLLESASWQMDIQREIDTIGSDQNRLILKFKNEAMDVLEKGLTDVNIVKNPRLLLNEIVLMTSTAAEEVSNDVYTRLYNLKNDFEDSTGLSLYDDIVKNNLEVDDDPAIVFDKIGTLSKLTYLGKKAKFDGLGIGTLGTIAGGVIGGIMGIPGGPAGIAIGIMTGAATLGGGIMAGGMIGGLVKAAKKPNEEAVLKIRVDIMKYINQTVSDWQLNHPAYMKDVSYNFIKSLRESIKSNQKTIEKDMIELQSSATVNSEKRAAEQKKLVEVKAGFSKLVARFSEIREIKVDAGDSKQNTDNREAESPSEANPNFNHLED